MKHFILAVTYTWWRGDALPALSPLPGLRCERLTDSGLLAELHGLAPDKINARLADANTAYVAYLHDEPAAYGWSGANHVGVANLIWPIPSGSRGLWNFVTLPAFRGRGIYPLLLQAILRMEETVVEKFWIGHRIDNIASQRGIEKAGFQLLNHVVLTPEEKIRLAPVNFPERAYGDPQGMHYGFVDLLPAEMTPFDFGNLSDDELELPE